MLEAVLNAFKIPDLRRKLLFTLGMLVIFRFFASIPVPGVNQKRAAGLHRAATSSWACSTCSPERSEQLLGRRAGRLPVYHRLDHHAADDADHPAAE